MSLRLTDLMRKIAPDLIITPTMGGSLPLHEFGSRLDAMQVYGAVLGSFGNR